MNDVYIIESWFGERLNVREVYAADADDAVQTHQMHYPGERIVSVQRGDGLHGDAPPGCCVQRGRRHSI
jgi:hypothetical protein